MSCPRPLPPPGLGQPGVFQVEAGAHQPPAAPRHRHGPGFDPPLDAGQACLQRLQPDRLAVPPGGGRVPGKAPGPGTGGDREPGLDLPDAGGEGTALGGQVPARELAGVLAGAGDRPGPSRRGLSGQCPLALPARLRAALRVEPAPRASRREVTPGERPEVPAHRTQHLSVPRGDAQPRPHPRSRRGRRNERRGDLAQAPAHPAASGSTVTRALHMHLTCPTPVIMPGRYDIPPEPGQPAQEHISRADENGRALRSL